MNDNMCSKFLLVRNLLPDEFENNGDYQINDENYFNKYNNNKKCETDIEKINAGCLFLFEDMFGDSHLFKEYTNNNIKVVEYIIIWLSYMLNLKLNGKINNLKGYYNQYINNVEKYNTKINGVTAYNSYKDLIDKNNYLLNMDMSIISKFYESFILLCDMNTKLYADVSNCKDYLGKAHEFVKKYDKLNEKYYDFNEKYSIIKGSSYNQILSTLSNDYNNLKNRCKYYKSIKYPSLPIYSRSVIRNTLIPFIFVVTAICLRIAYKYSLFGFREKFKKQHLKRKIKKIIKKMNY
ncbi:PIR protein [Plasmodium yoelii yoelii]|uniref:PIR protein n=2 Tax=Plasmodium yoelii TaxID=5861 RepID=A0AAF0B640_PLAYO|nr:PIR protein [Plasmodium yoelii yoelii]